MAFDPLDWIGVADSLATGTDEAPLRTAIGRYYYAVFLKSRLSLAHDGKFTPTGRGSDHSGVSRALKMHRASAGTAMENLGRLRERADYEPTASISPREIAAAKEWAEEVTRMCSGDWERLP